MIVLDEDNRIVATGLREKEFQKKRIVRVIERMVDVCG